MPAGPQAFAPGACERLEPFLEARVVGQGLALRQLCDAVCDHINNPNPIKPLVLSVHGPPGVGKSMVHQLAARALYNAEPAGDMQCPGIDCPGYKVHPHASTSPVRRNCMQPCTSSEPCSCMQHMPVHGDCNPVPCNETAFGNISCCLLAQKDDGRRNSCIQVLYGMDYIRSERAEQHSLLRAALMDHIDNYPEALIVIEEYDKLDCATRGFFRQLLENARTANITLDRCVPLRQEISDCHGNDMYCNLDSIALQARGRRKRPSVVIVHAQG
jgi:hypothetical protein